MKQQQGKKPVDEVNEAADEPVKTFEGGFFRVNSPVKPGKFQFIEPRCKIYCNYISMINSSLINVYPFQISETKSPRKSSLQSLSRSSSKPSTPTRFSKSPSCASPLLLHVISRRSRSIGGAGVISPLVNTDNSLTNTSTTGRCFCVSFVFTLIIVNKEIHVYLPSTLAIKF